MVGPMGFEPPARGLGMCMSAYFVIQYFVLAFGFKPFLNFGLLYFMATFNDFWCL